MVAYGCLQAIISRCKMRKYNFAAPYHLSLPLLYRINGKYIRVCLVTENLRRYLRPILLVPGELHPAHVLVLRNGGRCYNDIILGDCW